MARTRSTRAVALGSRAEDVEAAADLGVLELAEVAVDVVDELVEVVVVRGGRHAEVPVELAATSSSQTCSRRAGSFDGSRAATWAYSSSSCSRRARSS